MDSYIVPGVEFFAQAFSIFVGPSFEVKKFLLQDDKFFFSNILMV